MSMILKGINLANMGESRRIVIYDNGHVVVKEERWEEDGYKHYRTLYDIQAIQIPKGHGRLIDENDIDIPSTSVDIFENCRNCNLLDDEQVKEIITNAPTILEAEGEDEC